MSPTQLPCGELQGPAAPPGPLWAHGWPRQDLPWVAVGSQGRHVQRPQRHHPAAWGSLLSVPHFLAGAAALKAAPLSAQAQAQLSEDGCCPSCPHQPQNREWGCPRGRPVLPTWGAGVPTQASPLHPSCVAPGSMCAVHHKLEVIRQRGCSSVTPVSLAYCQGNCGDSGTKYGAPHAARAHGAAAGGGRQRPDAGLRGWAGPLEADGLRLVRC